MRYAVYCKIHEQTIKGLSRSPNGRYYATHSRQLTGKMVWLGSKPDKALKRFQEWEATFPKQEPTEEDEYVHERQYWDDLYERVRDDRDAWNELVSIVRQLTEKSDERSAQVIAAVAPPDSLDTGWLTNDNEYQKHYDPQKIERILAELTATKTNGELWKECIERFQAALEAKEKRKPTS